LHDFNLGAAKGAFFQFFFDDVLLPYESYLDILP
jgi:hypothetical protein